MCKVPKKATKTAFEIFENKNFNEVKQRLPHLSKREITTNLRAKWDLKLTEEEKKEFADLAS